MAKVFRVAFCGAGSIVRGRHLPVLGARTDRFRVVGLFDIVPGKAKELAGDRFKAYDSYEDLLGDGDVDIVVVATKPLETHFPAARQALEAGKHVVIEKPMAVSVAECDELIAITEKHDGVLTVHQNRRLDLDFQAVQDVLRRGDLGAPILVENRKGGGYQGDFVDWGIHLVDQALLLNRSPLREVTTVFCNPQGAPEDGGYADTTLRFAEPPLVRVAIMPQPSEYLQNGTPAATRFYVAGTKGTFTQRVIEDPRDLMNATQNFDGVRPPYAVPPYLNIEWKDFYDYLYESLARGAPLLVRPEEARNAIRVIELMTESAKSNKTVPATNMVAIPDSGAEKGSQS